MRVAIHPDDYSRPGHAGEDASSPRWASALEAAGHEVRWVNVYRADILEQLDRCDGFMWRHAHSLEMQQVARRLLPVIERELGLAVYPDQATCWHYDDKIAQAYLLPALGIPVPRTWAWFDREAAERWARTADYPIVAKLATGAGSENVRLVETAQSALALIDILWSTGVGDLSDASLRPARWRARARSAARALVRGRPLHKHGLRQGLHYGYALFQEFVADNAWDTRVTVIGHRAFAFRRFNRPRDFRASGSGALDPTPEAIDLPMVRLAFETARRLDAQSVAIDGLRRGDERLVAEVSYTYMSSAVRGVPRSLRAARVSGVGRPRVGTRTDVARGRAGRGLHRAPGTAIGAPLHESPTWHCVERFESG